MASGPLIKISDKLFDFLDLNGDTISSELLKLEEDPTMDNDLNLEIIDISDNDFSFSIKTEGNWTDIKIGSLIRHFFPGMFTSREIGDFTVAYNKFKNGIDPKRIKYKNFPKNDKPKAPNATRVQIRPFKFEPLNVRETFLSLVTQTYPYGHEEDVVPFIKEIGLQKDKFGNYYKVIGKSDVMFTSHLDTADRTQKNVTVLSTTINGEEILHTDKKSILGADDKAGVTVMLYMMANSIPGVYYFFIGEERGGIGSSEVFLNFDSYEHLGGLKKCISFDRRNYHSVITSQFGQVCCSDQFASELCKQYNSFGMDFKPDPTGVFTDSANFTDVIPECTNISVGYFKEHTEGEHQNIDYLKKLCQASVKIKWNDIQSFRKIGYEDLGSWDSFMNDLKSSKLNCEYRVFRDSKDKLLGFKIESIDLSLFTTDILSISKALIKNGANPDFIFDDDWLLMSLKDDKIGSISKEKDIQRVDNNSENYHIYNLLSTIKDYDNDSEGENIAELGYYLRKVFKNYELKGDVRINRWGDIDIYVNMDWCVRISEIVRLIDVLNSLQSECFYDFECDMELYENKGDPFFRISFYND